jgi:poly(hydroxyalkanoate) granule-associated protein
LRVETDTLAAEGPWVIVRFTARGTQQIPLFGLRAGELRALAGVACFSVGDAGIEHVWLYVDAAQLAGTVGLRSTPPEPAGTESEDRSGSWIGWFGSGARDIWLAGVGAINAAGEQGERLFHALAEQGRVTEPGDREGTSRDVQTTDARTRAFADKARTVVGSGQEYIRGTASAIRERLDLPTRAEFDELARKVEGLTALVESTACAPVATTDAVRHSTEASTAS